MEQWQVRLFSPYLLMVLSWPFTSIGSITPTGQLSLIKRTVGTVWQLGRERRIFRGQGVERLKGREPDELAKR